MLRQPSSWPSLQMRVLCAAIAASTLPAGAALAQSASPAATAASPAPSAWIANRRIVIDPVTHRPRAPEHDEVSNAPSTAAKTMARASSSATTTDAAAPATPTSPALQRLLAAPHPVSALAGGVRRSDLSQLSFIVAQRNADGTLSSQCVTGQANAQAALQATQSEESNHDR